MFLSDWIGSRGWTLLEVTGQSYGAAGGWWAPQALVVGDHVYLRGLAGTAYMRAHACVPRTNNGSATAILSSCSS